MHMHCQCCFCALLLVQILAKVYRITSLFRTLVLRWRDAGVITMEQCVWLLTGTYSALLRMRRYCLLRFYTGITLTVCSYSISSKVQILFTNFNFQSLAECMGGELLAHVCEVFSKGFAHSRGGLPDLTLWNPAELSCKVSQQALSTLNYVC